MSWKSKRQVKEEKAVQRQETRNEKLYFSDLWWAAGRRFLNDKEWYDLHKLSLVHGKYGPERLEYELGKFEELREYFRRHSVNSKDSFMNALERHVAIHREREEKEKAANEKPIVKMHKKQP